MIKKVILCSIAFLPALALTQSADINSLDSIEVAQNARKNVRVRSAAKPRATSNPLNTALQLSRNQKYAESSQILFRLMYNPRFRSQQARIRYLLGLNLWKMKMYQLSAFQFISVVKSGSGKYLDLSLEKLSMVADQLGDDSLLNYAISRVSVNKFPASQRDMLYFRIGEYQQRNGQFKEAAESYSRVGTNSPLYSRAKYQQGLVLNLAGNTPAAIETFDELIVARQRNGVTDPARVAALMGKARALYQLKKWDEAIEFYRQVPRDTPFWHDTIFESSWAMMRSGRFRSALSNFHSLHSAFYEDHYLPESLLLRSIVYLYICKNEELNKVLDLFLKIYKPVYVNVDRLIDSKSSPAEYFNMISKIMIQKKKGNVPANSAMPYLVAQKISQEGDFQKSYSYIRKLLEERMVFRKQSTAWQSSDLGKYAKKVLDTRIQKAKVRAGRQIRTHLLAIKQELVELFEQEGFIRYESINSKKEELKKEIASKDLPREQVDDDRARNFYIQNGYQYWPFQGEYWLDEIGNYHYVGTQSCK